MSAASLAVGYKEIIWKLSCLTAKGGGPCGNLTWKLNKIIVKRPVGGAQPLGDMTSPAAPRRGVSNDDV